MLPASLSLPGGYFLEAVGWESPTGRRIAFKAMTRLTFLGPPPTTRSPGGFLGYWSVEPTGLDPRLLAEGPGGFVVPRFGKYLGISPGKTPAEGTSLKR
ncbi:MAG: hypothetical protein ACREMB_18735 [Candidatus Rokuibacteriota bacterium]